MENFFAKCGTLRQRFRKHRLTTKSENNYGAFYSNDSVFGVSYSRTESHDGCNEAKTQRPNKPKGDLLSIATNYETSIDSRKDSVSNTVDISSESAKELTKEIKEKITSLLNVLYADEFVEDAFLLEIMTVWFASDERFELQGNNGYSKGQSGNTYDELQEWIDIMSEKIYNGETQRVKTWKGRIPGPVGRPIIGGRTMLRWLRKNRP